MKPYKPLITIKPAIQTESTLTPDQILANSSNVLADDSGTLAGSGVDVIGRPTTRIRRR